MPSIWRRLPVDIRAVLTGLVAALAGTLPWAALVKLNIRYLPTVPWAVLPAAFYLWLYWRYLNGAGWPHSTAGARRTNCRANRLPDDVWGAAILAGILGLAALVLFQRVMNRLVSLPQQKDLDPSKFPLFTVFLWVVMGSIVAGIVEEASFRGYLQRPIERRHGPVLAILITGTLFGFAHFSHPEVGLILLPYYLAVAAIYGALAYLTDSILPSMMLHAGGNMLGAFALFAAGTSEWQATPHPNPLIWQTGIDSAFVLSVLASLLAGAAAIWAYTRLAAVARTHAIQNSQ
jgi:membrane protease YdiL (CAAX protease family)